MKRRINYSKLTYLLADDFSSFRNSVQSMLHSIGASQINMASNAGEVIESCKNHVYDVILCDYNLGTGRTGQHVLEELRHKQLISRQTVFIIVSAESARTVVMGSFDCEPDDYLMKPITARILEQRMERLLRQRDILWPAYRALDAHDFSQAIDVLIDLSLAEDRYSSAAQKLLGSVFLQTGDLDKAERLYTRALEIRQLDWARLGLAKVKQAQGELELAGKWLEQIVEANPLYLPAYDVLAQNWERKGEKTQVQQTVQRAVDISPMSILRQKYLAEVAIENDDLLTALEARRRSIRLGKLSCHGSPEDNFTFARTASMALARDLEVDAELDTEALSVLEQAKQSFRLSESQLAQCNLLAGRIHAQVNRSDKAEQYMAAATHTLESINASIDVELDHVQSLLAMNKIDDAEKLLRSLQHKYEGDEASLEKLDPFLDEPASESNREMVTVINREGIDLYSDGKYDEALACFERVRKLFPKHVGIQLNMVQAYIGKLKNGDGGEFIVSECRSSLELIASLIEEEHPQFDRYQKLRNMAYTYY